MSNREKRIQTDHVHLIMAFARPSQGEKSNCIRTVDYGRGDEVDVLEAKLKVLGGYWRIHRTVNARCVKTALKILMCNLINHPEKASHVDCEWRTALSKPDSIYGRKKFMLDVDTQDEEKLKTLESMLNIHAETYEKESTIQHRRDDDWFFISKKIKSPNGWHYITAPFDTREVCKLPYVTLLRDGFIFIKEVGKENYEKMSNIINV